MTAPCWAVVPAAGLGRRIGGEIPKQYLQIQGRSILDHTLAKLIEHPLLQGVIVAIGVKDEYWPDSVFADHSRLGTVYGGAERVNSVLNALDLLAESAPATDWVLVHDAARPCVSTSDISHLIEHSQHHDIGGTLGAPVADTLKRVDGNGKIVQTVDRSNLWRALTPQMFRLGMLRDALRTGLAQGVIITDECSAMEAAGYQPLMVQGSAANIKITHPEDLLIAEQLLGRGR